ncbi:maleylpyruvate isomerase family mycothiol-dependent enzyme [Rhodococcus sp. Eu-32]|uniref:maleylpyruvate isomerase N-terminal domain-containing protein n=1 Tax=Rhodococcus sp. Eu-32 TaxID=1017319 RepID=UPI000DF11A21|nr:maleylpyruvate isomerase N-terminal domain-containing protein [Rhodococcus sp. Eu-32]RRQ25068.1 maleylpyruvate isomerase family mycothiol-dependent enzyme [Rhodococcus sp. Eu-32]
MTPDQQLDLLAAECTRMGSLSLDDASAPVPSMPDWTVEKLVRHVTFVHRMARAALSAPAADGMAKVVAAVDKPERGPAVLDDYAEAAAAMLDDFRRVDLQQPVATWAGEGTADYWIRRQLHEVTVHRFDAQDAVHARGGAEPDAADPAGAADGVAEWAEAFLTRVPLERVPDLRGRTIHLHTDDGTDMELFVDFTGDAVAVTREHRNGDVALRGSAQDLLLTVWRRRPFETLDVVGDEAVGRALYDGVRI